MTVYVHRELYPPIFNSCSERLCEGIDETLRKDDSFNSTLAIYHELFNYGA